MLPWLLWPTFRTPNLRNEYRQFGANFKVYHHTEFLADLVTRGRLKINRAGLEGSAPAGKVTFHDPCYLGRYQGIYAPARDLLWGLPGGDLIEMPASRSKSFCCGGGGGLSWAEEKTGTRINHARADQALETGAGLVATAYPFCMSMLTDGVNARRGERNVLVKDIAEILDESGGVIGQEAGEEERLLGPLEGLRIIAISQYGAGPYATQVLADLGAEILKIEHPGSGGDVGRTIPPFEIDGDSLFYQSYNRNKRSIGLNFRRPRGMEILHRLVEVSDAVYYNLRGDLPARLGLLYDDLKSVNPRIVCCSLSGFGLTGPRAAEPGYDYPIQGMAGIMSLTGDPAGPPTKAGVSFVDYSAGLASSLGLMVGALRARETGIGCQVDVSLLDTAISMLGYLATWHLTGGFVPRRIPDSAHPSVVPSQVFPTKDGHIVIMPQKEQFWQLLCDGVDARHLADDPRFRTFADRLANRETLIPILKEIFATRTTAQWLEVLGGRVPCAPVNDVAAALRDPQVLARDMLVQFEHPSFGQVKTVGCPIKVHGVETRPLGRAPSLGADTAAVLKNYLGLSDLEIEELREAGIIVTSGGEHP